MRRRMMAVEGGTLGDAKLGSGFVESVVAWPLSETEKFWQSAKCFKSFFFVIFFYIFYSQ